MPIKSSFKPFLTFMLIALAYLGASHLGNELALMHRTASPVWPASGVAIGALFIFGARFWPAILLGSLIFNFTKQTNLSVAAGITVANFLETISAVLFIKLTGKKDEEPSLRKLSTSVLLASLFLGASLGSLIGAGTLFYTGVVPAEFLSETWLTWFVGDFVGALVILPLFLFFKPLYLSPRSWKLTQIAQSIFIIFISCLLIVYTFSFFPYSPLIFLLFPILLFTHQKLSRLGLSFFILFVCSTCIWQSIIGEGPFSSQSQNDNLIHLQVFLASFTIASLLITDFSRRVMTKRVMMVLLLGWSVCALSFHFYEKNDKLKDSNRLEMLVEEQLKKITTNFGYYYEALEGAAGLFAASERVEVGEWKSYVNRSNIIERRPGIRGVGQINIVDQSSVDNFVKKVRENRFPDFSIKKVPGVERPEGSDKSLYIISLIEPMDTNHQALGLDIGSESNRRASADLARDTGLPTISKRITLVQASKRGPGFLLYVPTYKSNLLPKTLKERRNLITGWVYAPFVTASFLKGAESIHSKEFNFYFYEGLSTEKKHLLYRSDSSDSLLPDFETTTSLSLGQQSFTIGWSRSNLFKYSRSITSALISLLGVIITLLLAGHIANLETTNERANLIADEKTKLLRDNEESLKVALEKANAATKSKTEFLANMSHEIRTPMNGILGMVSLMGESELTKDQKALMNTVKNCGNGLLRVLNDILDFSKIESGNLKMESLSFDLRKSVRETVKLLKYEADKQSVSLDLEIDKKVANYVIGDEMRLRQVLFNLIGNAIKFSKDKSVQIKIQPKEKDHIFFEIKDDGIGIKEKDKEKLFNPFSQADGSISRKYGGTGLGLVISSRLCNIMGGQIDFLSEEGKGSSFFFSLPLKEGSDLVVTVKEDNNIDYSQFSKDHPSKILVVEDNLVNQRVAKLMLAKMGYEIDLVANGQLALDLLETKSFDIIFMDMQMPVMDGLTATRKIIERFGDKRPYIVAMTANVFEEDKDKCFEAGMLDYISKPFSLEDFADVINRR